MFGPWWLDLGHGWISASYVALLAGVWYAPRPLVRLVLLGAIVIASLWAWLSAYRRYHLITEKLGHPQRGPRLHRALRPLRTASGNPPDWL